MAYHNTPMRLMALEKVMDLSGEKPLGSVYTYTYKSLNPMEALRRAVIALKRDLPDENPVNWKVVEDEQAPEAPLARSGTEDRGEHARDGAGPDSGDTSDASPVDRGPTAEDATGAPEGV